MKTVFITGAASGIGLATARRFAADGWFVGLYDINQDGVEKLLASGEFANACGAYCNVTERDSIQQALDHFASHTAGRLDLLVNNAGVLTGGEFHQIDSKAHDMMIAINVKGLTDVAQLAFPLLKQTPNATLLNLCSVSSVQGIPQLAVYSASKFYVNGLTEALNVEWKPYDIRVTCVKPPIVNTAMGASLPKQIMQRMAVDLLPEQVAEAIYRAVPGSNAGYLLGLKAQAMGVVTRLCPWFIRRKMIAYVTSYN
jgi:NAD(P)-dependent dehydrogenase (short-subunit alcohol dehydrogenase family)